MDRRAFLATAAAAGLAAVKTGTSLAEPSGTPGKFNLKYAPNLNTFKAHAGPDPIDNLKFMCDQGFNAAFDNGLPGKSPQVQEQIGQATEQMGMTLGPFVMFADWKEPTMVTGSKEVRAMLVDKTRQAIEVAKRTHARWALLAPGLCSQRIEWDYQTANVVDILRACADVAEPAGLVIVIEPLNWWANHPGLFLQKIPQAYQICKAVKSPSIKIINDLYHQQITEGNLIPNIDKAWDEIAAFHVGDNPGRKEPWTGEINYLNIFKHIHGKGYTGTLCMEHGNSKGSGREAELSLIAAYRKCDAF